MHMGSNQLLCFGNTMSERRKEVLEKKLKRQERRGLKMYAQPTVWIVWCILSGLVVTSCGACDGEKQKSPIEWTGQEPEDGDQTAVRKIIRLKAICEHLVRSAIEGTSPDHSDIVSATQYLDRMADDMRDGYKVRITDKDDDDPRVTHTAYFISDDWGIGLRFRYDPDRDKFHIVGYWTILEPGDRIE